MDRFSPCAPKINSCFAMTPGNLKLWIFTPAELLPVVFSILFTSDLTFMKDLFFASETAFAIEIDVPLGASNFFSWWLSISSAYS